MTGDHRGFYFDINETKLFCDKSEEAYDFSGRILQSKNKKNVGRYLEQLSKHIHENKIYNKLVKLHKEGPNHHIIKMLDRTFTLGCISAEKKCKRTKQGDWT